MAPRKNNGKGKASPKKAPVAFIDGESANPEIRKADGRWQKGVSGNPGGQPRGMGAVRKLARSYTEAAIETLAEIMQDKEQGGPARVSAAEALLNRGYGKPVQQMEVGKPGDFTEMSEDQVDAFIAQAVQELTAAKKPEGDDRVIN